MAIILHATRIRLNQAGYGPGGCYYGAGAPLYALESEDTETGRFGDIQEELRALGPKMARVELVARINRRAGPLGRKLVQTSPLRWAWQDRAG